jgi:hypothetical protein
MRAHSEHPQSKKQRLRICRSVHRLVQAVLRPSSRANVHRLVSDLREITQDVRETTANAARQTHFSVPHASDIRKSRVRHKSLANNLHLTSCRTVSQTSQTVPVSRPAAFSERKTTPKNLLLQSVSPGLKPRLRDCPPAHSESHGISQCFPRVLHLLLVSCSLDENPPSNT